MLVGTFRSRCFSKIILLVVLVFDVNGLWQTGFNCSDNFADKDNNKNNINNINDFLFPMSHYFVNMCMSCDLDPNESIRLIYLLNCSFVQMYFLYMCGQYFFRSHALLSTLIQV
jgi:hypothetical protein